MYRFIRFSLICSLLAISSVLEAGSDNDKKMIRLFDGKSLEGWSVQCHAADADKGYWFVEDGVIVCNSMANAEHDYIWLQYEQEFADFELTLKFKVFRECDGNSGVQVRSRYDRSQGAPGGGWLDGPQIDIHPHGSFRNGLVYDETRSEKRWLFPSLPDYKIKPEQGAQGSTFRFADEGNGWNEMRIRCEGTRIQTFVNGIAVSNYEGAGTLDDHAHQALNVGMSGFIALQLHRSSRLKLNFKDLFVQEL